MSNIFAKLDVNPFADDVVTEPRRISFSVKGLNEKPLEQLIASFRKLMEGELPRRQIVAHKAQLVVSPDRGYGKSHLLGRLFKSLGEEATLIYLRPFQDPQRIWSSILQATVQELERPDQQNGKEAGSQLEAFSKGVLAHVSADHIADVKNDSRMRDAVRYLRAHPLKVLGRAPGSKPLVEAIKSRLDEPNFLQKLARLLRRRGIDLGGRETAWLKVLTGYAFHAANGLEQDAALKWLRGEPLEAEELNTLKLTNADNEGKPDSSAQEINELCFQRLKGLCMLSSYYRPFVFCFDQTEFYGSDRALVNALGKGVEALHATVPNQLTIVTTNATNWTEDVLPVMDPAYRDRFSRDEITLEGITANQAKDLIKHRLADFQVEETAVRKFIEEGSWLHEQFRLREIGVRDLLIAAAERFRTLAKPTAEPRQRTPLADLFAIEANKIRANEALYRYNQDCLMWFAQALAEGYDRVAIHKTRQRYFAVQWAWPDLSIYFAFESGDHNARWRAIAREAIELAGSAKLFGALVFRTPDLKTIPRPTWGVAKTQISEAQKKGLRIVCLSIDEVCELHAARELYSNALQGNIDYDATDVLKWLKARFEPWLERCRKSAVQEGHSERPLHIVQNQNNGTQPTIHSEMELTEAQLKTVLNCVSQKLLVDINEILRTLGDESLKPAVLRAVEHSRNIKAHSGPQTIYLQWRVVA
jgi:hypothetical protein